MRTGFGAKLRELRQEKGLTLRSLAEAAGVDFTYLSKIENERVEHLPSVDTIRDLAQALEVDPIDLLEIANKLPPELAKLAASPSARRFLQRAQEIASPKDWDALLGLLEERQLGRAKGGEKGNA
jgi:transcriptional regulator with XRE-family HTH domain